MFKAVVTAAVCKYGLKGKFNPQTGKLQHKHVSDVAGKRAGVSTNKKGYPIRLLIG